MNRVSALFALVMLVAACDSPIVEPAVQAPSRDNPQKQEITEPVFLSGMAVDSAHTARYEDEHGSELSFEEFISTVTAGRTFAKSVEIDGSLATFTINSIESAGQPVKATAHQLKVPLAGQMPPLNLADLGGVIHDLGDGKRYTLLSFFFSDCVPCIKEVPELNMLATSRAELDVLAVTFDSGEQARRFASKYGFTVSIVADAQEYIDALGIGVYPTLLLISPDGRLVAGLTSRKTSGEDNQISAWLDSLGV